MASLHLTAPDGLPEITPGTALVPLLVDALTRAGVRLADGDVLAVTSKIVSKAEDRLVQLAAVQPGERAHELARVTGKDPRMVELVLWESERVVKVAPNVLVVRHKLGFVSANAGVDQSNVAEGEAHALLLPVDPDGSAERLRAGFEAATGARVGVVLTDSHGRPHRKGNVGVAIGAAGLPALLDLRGQPDRFGRALKITIMAFADMIASAAGLLTGEGAEGRPLVHLRGLTFPPTVGKSADQYRRPEEDLYL